MKKLKLLLSLRAWLKSRTLNVAAITGAAAASDIGLGTGILQKVLDVIVSLGVTQPVALAALIGGKAALDALLRAKTDKGLGDK